MKRIILEFLRRGLIACGLGPIVLAILYLILQHQAAIETLTVNQVCIGIFSLSALAFIAGGMNVIYQSERLPLGIPCEDVVIALESIVSPVSIYDPIYSDGGDTIFVLDQLGDNNDDNNWLDEISLKESIKNLSEREKTILSLRFMQGKTQMEVSEEIGISQAQVSRLEKGAIDKIKN